MHRPRIMFASGSLGGIAIVAGGTNNFDLLGSADLYDSFSGRWEMLPNMHSPRVLCSGFFMDGKFYAIGGMLRNEPVTSGEEFDLETRQWRTIEGMYPYMNQAPHSLPLVAVVNNELFSIECLNNVVKKYNKMKNMWDGMGRLPPLVDSWNGWVVGFKAYGDQLLVIRGQQGYNGEEDLVVNSWCPKWGAKDGKLDWKVIVVKEDVGRFVFNCAVMAC